MVLQESKKVASHKKERTGVNQKEERRKKVATDRCEKERVVANQKGEIMNERKKQKEITISVYRKKVRKRPVRLERKSKHQSE
ncbi:hypothetical protein HanIR_Chr12g0563711 [Helianthus annuus]|nr:hypothetical protein HanIR_Chr12g0563711 [Helianthus annuus]